MKPVIYYSGSLSPRKAVWYLLIYNCSYFHLSRFVQYTPWAFHTTCNSLSFSDQLYKAIISQCMFYQPVHFFMVLNIVFFHIYDFVAHEVFPTFIICLVIVLFCWSPCPPNIYHSSGDNYISNASVHVTHP